MKNRKINYNRKNIEEFEKDIEEKSMELKKLRELKLYEEALTPVQYIFGEPYCEVTLHLAHGKEENIAGWHHNLRGEIRSAILTLVKKHLSLQENIINKFITNA